MHPLDDKPIAARLAEAFAKVGLAVRSQQWDAAGRAGINPAQAQVLALLHAREPNGLRLNDIAEELAVTPASASDSVAALERKGFITKQRSADDGRAISVKLTRKGRTFASRDAAAPPLFDEAADYLTDEERAVLLRAMLKMIRTMQRRRQIPVARMCVTCAHFRPNAHASAAEPHHCALVDAAFGDTLLRVDCPEHEPADDADADRAWRAFNKRVPRATGRTTRTVALKKQSS